MSKKRKINIGRLAVKLDDKDFISLTDIAKAAEKPAYIVCRWLRNPKTIAFLKKWEKYFNPNVKVVLYDHLLIRFDNLSDTL